MDTMQSTDRIDIVTLLQLDLYMDQKELEATIRSLMEEVVGRLVNEELPKLLSSEDYTVVKKKLIELRNITAFSIWFDEQYPAVHISSHLDTLFFTVKKEFVLMYLENLKNSLKQKLSTKNNKVVEQLLSEIKTNFNQKKLDYESLYKNVGSLLFYQSLPLIENNQEAANTLLKQKMLRLDSQYQITLEKKAFTEQYNALKAQYDHTFSEDEKKKLLEKMKQLINKFQLVLEVTNQKTRHHAQL